MTRYGCIFVVSLVATVSCKKDPPASAPDEGASEQTEVAAPAKPVCDVAGDYKLRFRSNGSEGWWFRFSIKDGKAELIEPADVLALQTGALELSTDPEACSFTVVGNSAAVGILSLTLSLDPESNAVAGTMKRTKVVSKGDEEQKVAGVRVQSAGTGGSACVGDGFYKLEIQPKAKWKTEEENDGRDCSDGSAMAFPQVLRVESFGSDIAVGLRESDPPFAESFPSTTSKRVGPCKVAVKIAAENFGMEAELTLAGATLAGPAEVSYQMVEDGPEGDGLWTCVTKGKVTLSGTQIKP